MIRKGSFLVSGRQNAAGPGLRQFDDQLRSAGPDGRNRRQFFSCSRGNSIRVCVPTKTQSDGQAVSVLAGCQYGTEIHHTGQGKKRFIQNRLGERHTGNQTIAIAYGPLVFSLPIPEKAEIVKRYFEAEREGLKDFYSYQYDPVDPVSAKRPLKLQSKPGFGFIAVRGGHTDPLHPWDRSPLKLRGQMIGADGKLENVALLPMGCTILRRTFFPVGN